MLLSTHLADCINREMTLEQCHHNSQPTSSKTLMGQVSWKKVLALQVEGQDIT